MQHRTQAAKSARRHMVPPARQQRKTRLYSNLKQYSVDILCIQQVAWYCVSTSAFCACFLSSHEHTRALESAFCCSWSEINYPLYLQNVFQRQVLHTPCPHNPKWRALASIPCPKTSTTFAPPCLSRALAADMQAHPSNQGRKDPLYLPWATMPQV